MREITLYVEDDAVVSKIKAAANMIKGVVSVKVGKQKEEEPNFNKETLEALEEIRSGKYAGELDSSSEEAIINSIMAL